MKVLVLGDTHIPERVDQIPKPIDEFIRSQKFDVVICTGDLTGSEVLDYLRSLGGKLVVVEGNMDHLSFPEYQTLKIEKLNVGAVHGHQVYPRGNREQLNEIAEELGVDVLLHGHTHKPDVYFGDRLLLNPGSATGAWGGGGGSMIPSFMILDFKEYTVNVNLYELKDNLKCTLNKTFEL